MCTVASREAAKDAKGRYKRYQPHGLRGFALFA